MARVTYRTADVDGFEVFYREAGERSLPTLLLLHGFPSSSHMYRAFTSWRPICLGSDCRRNRRVPSSPMPSTTSPR
jgi:pimeloyl-ACP methyl ester carboxylesterase